MKIFVSWSGDASRITAEKLRDWLKSLFPMHVEVFVSSKDIEKGDRWSEKLASVLQDYDFGIVVVDHSNKEKPWVLFEAGALSKSVSKNRLIPLLCDITPGDLLESPLGQFQGAPCDKEGLIELARAVNKNLDRGIADVDLLEAFDVWWDRKGKPVCELGLIKSSGGKRDIQPTTRDIIARIDRSENQLKELLAFISARLSMSEEVIRREFAMHIGERNRGIVPGGLFGGVSVPSTVTAPTAQELVNLLEQYSLTKKDAS